MHGILIFGDSITAGRGVAKDKSWVARLAQFFDKRDKYNTIVYNLGVPGESTAELLERFNIECKSRTLRRDPGDRFTVIFSIGVNDTKGIGPPGKSKTPINVFRSNIQKLIKLAERYTTSIIFVGLIPVDENKTTPIDKIDNNYFLNNRIKIYNKIIKNICKDERIPFVDLLDDWFKEDYRRFLAEDGIHPNESGHQRIYKEIAPLITNLFSPL